MDSCSRCGSLPHLFDWMCELDVHGKDDPFKTSCADCGETIPSGADRAADKFGNIYCDMECLSRGYETIIDRVGGLEDVVSGD